LNYNTLFSFAVASWAVENVLFYHEVQKFKTLSPEQRLQKAQKIKIEYLIPGTVFRHLLSFPYNIPFLILFLAFCCPTFFLLYFFKKKGAPAELNTSGKVVEEINEKIEEGGEMPTNLFDQAEQEVLQILEFSVYPLWKKSKHYKKALKLLKIDSISDLRLERKSSKGRSKQFEPEIMEIQTD